MGRETVDELPTEEEAFDETLNVVNVSSLTNKIKLDDIKPVSIGFLTNKLNKQFKENAKDERYPRDRNGKEVLKFYESLERRRNNEPIFVTELKDSSGRKQDFKWSEKDYGVVEALIQELDELAIKYDVPKLRGINVEKVH